MSREQTAREEQGGTDGDNSRPSHFRRVGFVREAAQAGEEPDAEDEDEVREREEQDRLVDPAGVGNLSACARWRRSRVARRGWGAVGRVEVGVCVGGVGGGECFRAAWRYSLISRPQVMCRRIGWPVR